MKVHDKNFVIQVSGLDEDEREWARAMVTGVNRKLAKQGGENTNHARISTAAEPSVHFTHLLVPPKGDPRRTFKGMLQSPHFYPIIAALLVLQHVH